MPQPDDADPWQTLASEQKYENAWIDVTEHQVVNPSGNPGIYGTVHFKHLAIGVIPIDEAGNTWLVGQYRYPLARYSWEIPMGGGELDIDPLESAMRELKEETGIEAARWKKLLELDLSNASTDERAIVYVAKDLSFGDATPEETEALTLRKLPFEEAYKMVESGEITDAISVAAILKLKLARLA